MAASDALDLSHFSFFINQDGESYQVGGTYATGLYFGYTGEADRDHFFLSISKVCRRTKVRERCLPTRVGLLEPKWAALLPDIRSFLIEPFPQGIPKSVRALYGLYWHQSVPLHYNEARLLLDERDTPIYLGEQKHTLPWITLENKLKLLNDGNVRLHPVARDEIEEELESEGMLAPVSSSA